MNSVIPDATMQIETLLSLANMFDMALLQLHQAKSIQKTFVDWCISCYLLNILKNNRIKVKIDSRQKWIGFGQSSLELHYLR